MNYPRVDEYSGIESIIHNFDPRAKIITFTTLIFSFVFIENISLAILAILFSIILVSLAKLPPEFVYRHLKYPVLFLFSIFFVMAFTIKGNDILNLPLVDLTFEGVYLGSLIFFRGVAALLLAFLIFSTSRFDAIIKAIYMMKLPNVFVQMIAFSYRYIFVIIDEFQNMKKALSSKGFVFGLNQYSLSLIGNMIGGLLIRSYERGDRVHSSMVSKGYGGAQQLFFEYNMKLKDYTMGISFIVIALLFHIYPVIL
ncbi:cobalt ECF transporter T component CbiQ [Methanohalophilus portucalensis]|uniref:Cobalt ABC transporter inner membrane subunit CbiQ n=2 Tax=Methanohalophilus portucalensis TaxID=39664 RepID=A0A1L9C393_9EURY|nr:cobalt ECF transporter T component CbiQ [Methanohalophilus portucalensis]ATU07566.1 cobalt ECF transporter T component CbiQ [Methanohalophilus portucalensis]OJH48957.1 cobalt ABC transporter inner membrane subunit CbiQ [Methanohalophilus portucalensis FDF-1]RNI10292.1 cobalt ECF transporter T component CbiQ [Methanohalophilus portucalensis FDF-1]SMH38072.1 cobalt/nickel transport system permease protein [Methanohalophilus portucalensis FDF-1]